MEIHLKAGKGITSSNKNHETKYTAINDNRIREASTATTKDESSKQTKVGTSYVNGKKVSSILTNPKLSVEVKVKS